jgi:carboxypeptidase C (cathepsin A)
MFLFEVYTKVSSIFFKEYNYGYRKQTKYFSGFSFTGKDECYAKNEEDVASDLYDALQQFFTLFPDLRKKNEFFVSGESYAGKYVPAITFKIHTMNEATKDENKKINLKVLYSVMVINY